MVKDNIQLSVLIIEDNLGDFVLLEDYLYEKFSAIQIFHEELFESAVSTINSGKKIDIILLDLILPDLQRKALVNKLKLYTQDIPIIILTGYTDIALAKNLLSLGLSDFLIKDDINPEVLYKSIIYALERKNYILGLKRSKKTYQDLFNLSPQPMWIYDISTLHFLDVNQAAIEKYGYGFDEFMGMTIKDIRPKKEVDFLEEIITERKVVDTKSSFSGLFVHTLKSGQNINVEIYSSYIEYNDKLVRLVLANDVTEKQEHIERIEAQNVKLKNIAWTQSHIVRAPLSRILGIVNLLELEDFNSDDLPYLMKQLRLSGNELDKIIQDIVKESKSINLNPLKNE